MKIEEHNLKEEIKEIVEKAVKTGVVNENCGVFRIMRQENYSPRGKAIMLNNGFYEKILYNCNLCRACEFNNNLCTAFLKSRQVLFLQKKEHPENKKMIENLRSTGNVWGMKE